MLHPTGPGNSSPVDLLIVAAIVTAMVWLAGTHRKLRAPYVIPVALFVARARRPAWSRRCPPRR